MTTPFRILVLCTGNSARSQIAEALFASRGAGRIAAVSAGTRPTVAVHPLAVRTLAEHGIAWQGRVPKTLDSVAGKRYDLAITVCDSAAEACPVFPGAAAQAHWGLPDPAAEQDPTAARRAFEATYASLEARITRLLALPLGELPPADVARHAARVHRELDTGASPH
jgi:arsenate reductase